MEHIYNDWCELMSVPITAKSQKSWCNDVR